MRLTRRSQQESLTLRLERNQAQQLITTNCRFELYDWRSLDQSKSIKTIEDLNGVQIVRRSIRMADVCAFRAQSGNETGTTNCRLESRDWHLLHQTKSLKLLKCLRLARHSVTIAELSATQAQSDNKSEPATCRFELRDWHSLGQQKESKQLSSELFAYIATLNNKHRCSSQVRWRKG